MVTSYIWLVLFIGLILLFTNRHLIASRRAPLKPNGNTIIEAIQHTYEIEEIELKKSVRQHEDDPLKLVVRLLFNHPLPDADVLAGAAPLIASQIKNALLHPEDFQSFKLYFINKEESQKQSRNSISLFEFDASSI